MAAPQLIAAATQPGHRRPAAGRHPGGLDRLRPAQRRTGREPGSASIAQRARRATRLGRAQATQNIHSGALSTGKQQIMITAQIGGSARVLPDLPRHSASCVNRRNRGAGLQTGPVRLVCRTPPSVTGRGACSSLRILRSLPACSRRERNGRLPTATDGAYATKPPTTRNPSELPTAPGAPGGRRACCAARAL